MKNTLVDISVTEINAKGNGIGLVQADGNAVICEVPFTLPGDIAKVRIDDIHDGMAKGALQALGVKSPLRIMPRCAHFGTCGGCRLQHVPYKGQLLHKEKIVRAHFGDLLNSGVTVHPIISSKLPWNYRTKMDYTFSSEGGQLRLGHVQEGTKGHVVDIQECSLTPQWFMDALICTRQWWEASKIPAYDPVSNKGTLRHLTLREGRRSGDRMVILNVVNRPDSELGIRHIEKFVERLTAHIKPQQEDNRFSISLRIQQLAEGMASSQYDMLLYGPGNIREVLSVQIDPDKEPANMLFEIGSTAFFQPNPQLTEVFYTKAMQLAGLTENSVVFDLYCGIGTLGICASKFVKKVVGIELSPEMAELARANAKLNDCRNVIIYSGAVRHTLNQLAGCGEPLPDVVIVNPPRVGLDALARQHVIESRPKKIVYISASPQSQAKDVALLTGEGYRLTDVLPVDLFPQTNHIQTICILERNS